MKFYTFLLSFLLFCGGDVKKEDNYERERKFMVKFQLKSRGIKDQKVLDAFLKVKRHLFVPKQYQDKAYEDYPLPIGEGQTISQPYMVALMTELLELKGTEKVLEIGTGSGYQAAILSLLAKEVYTIEIIKTLAERAKKLLNDLGYKNVHVKCGDGYLGWPEYAPFDRIIITCALEILPPPLIEQLKEGGIIVAPIGPDDELQYLTVYRKVKGKLIKEEREGCYFVPMRGMIEKLEEEHRK